MKHNNRQFCLNIKTQKPEQQASIERSLKDLTKDFPFVDINIKPESKKLVPFEILSSIAISFAVGISAKLMIRFFEKLYKKLTDDGITPEIEGLDRIQKKAERYLIEIGVRDFEIIRREEKGLYVFFIFRDNTGAMHHLYITSFDLRVIEYKRTS